MYIPLPVITWVLGILGILITSIGIRKSTEDASSVAWFFVGIFGALVLLFGFFVAIGEVL